jgi:hypothetical protein
VTTGNIRQTIERVLTLIALAATAYIALHKFYAEVKPKGVVVDLGPNYPHVEKHGNITVIRPTSRSVRHWPCFILALLLVLISTGGMLDLVLLLR